MEIDEKIFIGRIILQKKLKHLAIKLCHEKRPPVENLEFQRFVFFPSI